ncbi:MAG: glycosyltransferase family 4 protein [Desulfobacterales bacterium]|nr:glycosyltransferase family 4 protein [Desulfobacterales bacterium]
MRLGLIIYGKLNTLTGGYIYDKILVEYLQECGHHVDIISYPRRNYIRCLLDNFSPNLYSKLVTSKYDILLQDELNHPSLFLSNHRLQKKLKIPIATIVHQVLCRQPRSKIRNWMFQTIEKHYLKTVDAFIFNSRTTRKTVELLVNGKRPSIVASPAGDRLGHLLSADLVESRAHKGGPLQLVFVGNILPNKRLSALIKGLSRLSPEKWLLTVVGSLTMDIPYARRIKKLIMDKKIGRQVRLVGPKDGTELAQLLSVSHVFIMPYSHEGFGMAHLEAMAFALPVIGSDRGAIKEFVIPGQNGFLIEPDDSKTVNACLNNLYHDRKSLIEMSHAALQTFKARPKWNETMESIHMFLTRLAKSGM